MVGYHSSRNKNVCVQSVLVLCFSIEAIYAWDKPMAKDRNKNEGEKQKQTKFFVLQNANIIDADRHHHHAYE